MLTAELTGGLKAPSQLSQLNLSNSHQLTVSVFLAVQDGEAVEAVDGVAGEVAYETY